MEYHQEKMQIIDERIEKLLQDLCQEKQNVEVMSSPKSIRHHAPKITDLHQMMVKLHGVNISSISGLNDYTLLRLVGETGVDMNRFQPLKILQVGAG